MKTRNSPSCECCDTIPEDPCIICEDTFNRANSSNITTGSPCGWTEVLNDLSIDSNRLKGVGMARMTPEHPDVLVPGFDSRGHVLASFVFDTTIGDAAVSVLLDYVNSSDYFRVSILQTFDASQTRVLVGRPGFGGTIEDSTFDNPLLETSYDLCVDWADDEVRYSIKAMPSGVTVWGNTLAAPMGSSGKVGVYLQGATPPYCNNYLYARSATEIEECDDCIGEGTQTNCNCCPEGFATEWSADLSALGMTAGLYWDSCNEVGGIYFLEPDGICSAGYQESFPVSYHEGSPDCPGPYDTVFKVGLGMGRAGDVCFIYLSIQTNPVGGDCAHAGILAIWSKSGSIHELCSGTHELTLHTDNVDFSSQCDGYLPPVVTIQSL